VNEMPAFRLPLPFKTTKSYSSQYGIAR
jgi:hypothetical protein